MNASADADRAFMRMAIEQALRGKHTARPNPIVGAVIVRDGELVSTGFHERAGGPHAERVAIDAATGELAGATMYVTLEPCSHFGRTAPCADALIEVGFGRVVAGMIDPNPRVSGRGFDALRAAGIEVDIGVLGEECWRLNQDFAVAIRAGRPMVTVKLATSLDGRIATRTGDSRWISGEASRRRVHEMRRDAHAILVGTNTLLSDDPRLTARLEGEPDAPSPHRFVLDAALRAPTDAAVFDLRAAPTTVFCAAPADPARRAALEERGVEVVSLPCVDGRLPLDAVLAELYARGMISVLVEGGGELAGALHDLGLVDRLCVFLGPLIIGGREAVPAVGGRGVELVEQATRARRTSVERIGEDLLVVAEISPYLDPAWAG